MGFPRQEYWSGFPFLSPGIFPTQGLNLGLPHALQEDSLPTKPPGKSYPWLNNSHLGSHKPEVSVTPKMGTGPLGVITGAWPMKAGGPALLCLPGFRSVCPGWQPQLRAHLLLVFHEVIPLGGPGISWGYFGVQGTLPAPLLSCLLCPLAGQGQVNSLLLAPVTIHLIQLVLLCYKPAPN